jgi:hypothetical protein
MRLVHAFVPTAFAALGLMLAARVSAQPAASGCPKLERSYQLEPLPGAVFTLAECESKWGKRKAALKHYRDYLDKYEGLPPDQQTKQRERKQVATDQVAALSAEVPTLKLVVMGSPPPGTVVKRDGEVVPRESLGVAEPMDAGEHTVSIEVPGAPPSVRRVVLGRGEQQELKLEPPTPPPPPDEDDASSGGVSSLAIWGYVTGGVGLAVLGVGIGTGVATLGKKRTIGDHCDGLACDREGKDAAASAKTLGAVSTAGFVVGLAATAAGAVMLIVDATSNEDPSATGLRWWPTVASTPDTAAGALVGVGASW